MWRAFGPLSRYIATSMVAKHRLFVWRDSRVYPDQQLIVIARDDDTTFGILHSRFSRGVVAPAWHQPGRPPALHAHHDLPDFPVSGGANARRSRERLRERSSRRGYRRGRPAAGRAKGPLAQPAGMGGVGGRTCPRLSQAPGRARRGRRQRSQETHSNQTSTTSARPVTLGISSAISEGRTPPSTWCRTARQPVSKSPASARGPQTGCARSQPRPSSSPGLCSRRQGPTGCYKSKGRMSGGGFARQCPTS